jgi:hypothetical protein
MVAANPFKGGHQLVADVGAISLVLVCLGADRVSEPVVDFETGFCIVSLTKPTIATLVSARAEGAAGKT